jgi:hypothetical protein
MRHALHRCLRALVTIASLSALLVAPTGAGAVSAEVSGTIPGVYLPYSPVTGNLWSGEPADVYYTMQLHPGDSFEATLTADDPNSFGLRLLPPGATSLTDPGAIVASEPSYPRTIQHSVTATGTYYLAATWASGAGDYYLTWQVTQSPSSTAFLEATPTTVTVTMYRDQTSAPTSRVKLAQIDTPGDYSWGGMTASSYPDGSSDSAWTSLSGFGTDGTYATFYGNLRIGRPSYTAGTYVAHITVPSEDARVADARLTVVCNVIAKTRAAVRLKTSVPSGFNEDHAIRVSGSLHTLAGRDIGGSVSIQSRTGEDVIDGWDPVWTTVKTVRLMRGAYSASVKVPSGCQVRVVYNGTSTYRRTASAAKLVRLRCLLSTVHNLPQLLSSYTRYTIHGHCSPTHFDSYAMDPPPMGEPPEVMRVQVQRYVHGRWLTTVSLDTAEADGRWECILTSSGSPRGRIRVSDICGEHDRVYSAWKYFYTSY